MKFNSITCAVKIFLYLTIPSNTTGSIQPPQQWNCNDESMLHWLWNLRNNDRCAHIIIERTFVPKCVFDQMINAKFVLQIYDLDTVKSRHIFTVPPTNCDNFLLFVREYKDIVDLFKTTRNRRFVPFSQLFIMITDTDTHNIKFDSEMLNYIYENGLFVFLIEGTHTSTNMFHYTRLHNVLTGEALNITNSDQTDVLRYFGSYKKHPFFDTNYKKKVFRVSFFKCAPYIIYLPDGTFDGIQYRMLQEIAKTWKIEHRKCDFSSTITTPWLEVLYNVNDDITDLAMCSIWMNKQYVGYDMSTYFDFQCGTYLVPKPKALNPAAYLYLSLNSNDWYGFVVSLIAMTICLTLFTKVGRKIRDSFKDYVYNDSTRSLIDALNMVTNHGLAKCPQENTMRLLVNRFELAKNTSFRLKTFSF